MSEFTDWIDGLIREATEDVLRNAERAMYFAKTQKKQAELMKAKDTVTKKQKQLGSSIKKQIKPKAQSL